jgi:Tol biopolymer transport system component
MAGMSSTDLDRRLAGFFASAVSEDVPEGLLEDVFGVTRSSRQRRGPIGRFATALRDWWRTPVFARVAPELLVYLVVLALLIVAAAIALAVAGARRPVPPFGLASNGLIAFDQDGDVVIAELRGAEVSKAATVPDARGPVFSPDGSRVAFYRTLLGADVIMVATPDGHNPIPVSSGVTLDDLATETPVSWSPDGRSLVFGGLAGDRRVIYLGSVDGGTPTPFGDAGLSRIDPEWSPDGAWIAFHGFVPAEDAAAGAYRTSAGLYLIRPDGRGQRLLVKATGGDFIFRKPQWLPDPTRHVLAYAVGLPSAYDIAVFDVDSMTQTVISRALAAETWPAWAPDGSELAWAASDSKIRVARPDGSNVRLLPADLDYELVWSPDKRYLLGFTTENRLGLGVMTSDGSHATIVMPLNGTSSSHWSWQRMAP